MENNKNICLELLHREVAPALGCTEPIAVALAVAKATETVDYDVVHIEVEVSANILKNGMGVAIPGTSLIGLDIAAALGAVCGRSCYGLEVLHDVSEKAVAAAQKYIDSSDVKISAAQSDKKLYIKAIVTGKKGKAVAIIEDCHDRVTRVILNDETLFAYEQKNVCAGKADPSAELAKDLTVEKIVEFGRTIPFEEIEFILKSGEMNYSLAEEGLNKKYGLNVGKTVADSRFSYIFGDGVMSYAMSLSAAASDARMAGSILPAMSNSGSGNQGITVTLPVVAVAKKLGSSSEELARALAISHLVAIHIKGYLGRLSALCGCVVASSGASCGVVYLMGGSYEQITYSIKNMIGNVTGMVCDGAKVGCALKVSSGVASAIQSAVLALEDVCISHNDGIIDKDIEKTIRNLAYVGTEGMDKADKTMLDIMLAK
ncbi:MAG: L-serine ammonia-lyase, iron-sulfur-dependent, subunit alpha [Rikenellaceae bacterium]